MKKYLKFIIPCIVVLLNLFYKTSLNYIAFEIVCDILFFGGLFLLLIFDKDNKDLLLTLALSPFMVYSHNIRYDATFISGNILVIIGALIHIKKYQLKGINLRNILFLVYICIIFYFTITHTIGNIKKLDRNYLYYIGTLLMLVNMSLLGYITINSTKIDFNRDKYYFILIPACVMLTSLISKGVYNIANLSIIIICIPLCSMFIKNKYIVNRITGYLMCLLEILYVSLKATYYQEIIFLALSFVILVSYLVLTKFKIVEISFVSSCLFIIGLICFALRIGSLSFFNSRLINIDYLPFYLFDGAGYLTIGYLNGICPINVMLVTTSSLGLIALILFMLTKYKNNEYNYLIILTLIFLDVISLFWFNFYYVETLFFPIMFMLLSKGDTNNIAIKENDSAEIRKELLE